MLEPTNALPETPAGVLARMADLVELERQVAAQKLALAAHWADLHPDPDDTGDRVPAYGQAAVSWLEREDAPDELEFEADAFIPSMAWDAGAPLAAALGMSTSAGERFIRDALLTRHRLPRVWARVHAGEVDAWRARRIADQIVAQPQDVSDALDAEVAPVADKIGTTKLDQTLQAIKIRLHAEEVEITSLEALESTYVRLDERSLSHTGLAELTIRGPWADLHDFDQAVTRVAAALKHQAVANGHHVEALDLRRARAVGILADPDTAAALLAADPSDPETPTVPPRSIELVVHVDPDSLADGRNPVARLVAAGGGEGRPVLIDLIREWCGNPNATVTVRPVLDLAEHQASGAYEAPPVPRHRANELANGHCTFPWCARPARACDLDHATPHDQGGATCSCNLHPLCRRHHRLKTHAGWQVTPLDPGVWHWIDPHGNTYRRDYRGTMKITTDQPSTLVPTTGCVENAAPWETTPPGRLRARDGVRLVV